MRKRCIACLTTSRAVVKLLRRTVFKVTSVDKLEPAYTLITRSSLIEMPGFSVSMERRRKLFHSSLKSSIAALIVDKGAVELLVLLLVSVGRLGLVCNRRSKGDGRRNRLVDGVFHPWRVYKTTCTIVS